MRCDAMMQLMKMHIHISYHIQLYILYFHLYTYACGWQCICFSAEVWRFSFVSMHFCLHIDVCAFCPFVKRFMNLYHYRCRPFSTVGWKPSMCFNFPPSQQKSILHLFYMHSRVPFRRLCCPPTQFLLLYILSLQIHSTLVLLCYLIICIDISHQYFFILQPISLRDSWIVLKYSQNMLILISIFPIYKCLIYCPTPFSTYNCICTCKKSKHSWIYC